jgi:hypothetical protein
MLALFILVYNLYFVHSIHIVKIYYRSNLRICALPEDLLMVFTRFRRNYLRFTVFILCTVYIL